MAMTQRPDGMGGGRGIGGLDNDQGGYSAPAPVTPPPPTTTAAPTPAAPVVRNSMTSRPGGANVGERNVIGGYANDQGGGSAPPTRRPNAPGVGESIDQGAKSATPLNGVQTGAVDPNKVYQDIMAQHQAGWQQQQNLINAQQNANSRKNAAAASRVGGGVGGLMQAGQRQSNIQSQQVMNQAQQQHQGVGRELALTWLDKQMAEKTRTDQRQQYLDDQGRVRQQYLDDDSRSRARTLEDQAHTDLVHQGDVTNANRQKEIDREQRIKELELDDDTPDVKAPELMISVGQQSDLISRVDKRLGGLLSNIPSMRAGAFEYIQQTHAETGHVPTEAEIVAWIKANQFSKSW